MFAEQTTLKKALVGLGAGALALVGLIVIVYVSVARDRIGTPTPMPGLSETALPIGQTANSVTGTVREYAPDALIIVITPDEGTIEQVIVPDNLEVAWKDGQRASPREILPGQSIYAEGTIDALGRMIADRIVILTAAPATVAPTAPAGETPAPTAESTAAPTATAAAEPTAAPTSVAAGGIPLNAWLGEYYDTQAPGAAATLVRQDARVDFQWQQGAPANGLPADHFSVRWRGRFAFQQGSYRFHVYSDDGARLWVDGTLVIDQWRGQAAALAYGDLMLQTGEHTVQIEYFDDTGDAQVRAWWDFSGAFPDWKGEYYSNGDLSGSPVLERNDREISFNWGAGSPDPSLPADRFSARWTRTLNFDEGPYRFSAQADDGIRLWIDGVILIDEWQSSPRSYVGDIWLDAGPHELRVDYFEASGMAGISLGWQKTTRYEAWKGEYFANADLSGRPLFVRDDEEIDFDWGKNAPNVSLPADNFGVRWTRSIALDGGRYRFWAKADDGVRVTVNGQRLIDDWRDGGDKTVSAEADTAKGQYDVVVEYYDRGGNAAIEFGWEKVAAPTAAPTDTPVPPTAAPTETPTPPLPTATPPSQQPTVVIPGLEVTETVIGEQPVATPER